MAAGEVDVGALRQQRIRGIFDVVGRETGFAVEPQVAHHAVDRGVRAGRERRMADDGLRVGVRVVRIAVDDALLPEVAEAAFAETIVVTRRQVAAQLVDRDLQDQLRRILRVGGAERGEQ
jgi:hypothetical protein